MPQLWACADGQLQSGSGNLDPDRDLPEEREVSTTAQDSISQPWISDRGRGVCGLSPSSSHACLVEFHPHPPRSPSQKPRSLSRVSVLTRVSTPLATTSQTVCNSSLIPSGPLIRHWDPFSEIRTHLQRSGWLESQALEPRLGFPSVKPRMAGPQMRVAFACPHGGKRMG